MRSQIRLLIPLLALGFVLTAMSAHAQKDKRVRYKWTDEQGNLHFADSISPEAARLGYDVMSGQGVVVKHVERAKTAEELAAAKLEAERLAETKRKAEDAQRSDAQLLAAYPTEDDLRTALQAQIEIVNQNIQATEVGIQSQEKSLAERLTHAADQERNGKPVPANVQQQIGVLKKGLTDQKAFLDRRRADRDLILHQLDDSISRYRELKRRADLERAGDASGGN